MNVIAILLILFYLPGIILLTFLLLKLRKNIETNNFSKYKITM